MAQHPLDQLIQRLARLPGLGPRSARRTALYLLKNRDQIMLPLASEMDHAARTVRACVECGNLDLSDTCSLCRDTRRDSRRICVVEDVSDLWAIERAGIFSGLYHVLGGTLSALDGRGPRELGIDRLIQRVTRFETNGQASPPDEAGEIILATSATVDGQTTAHYIAERLEHLPVKVTRLAHGVPVGGELNYLDDGTLAQAMKARSRL
ncbi:MAG TPA: recombination protein RecR [Alphaproteobacteria bacterium]|nr:recombination protein RecR [Alphaproteobacteria bacterium]